LLLVLFLAVNQHLPSAIRLYFSLESARAGHGRTEREGEESSRLRAVEEHPVERRRRPVGDVDPVGEERWVAVAGAADA